VTSIKPIIAVVDDEWSVRVMLGRVLRLADYRVAAFARGEDFIASLDTRRPACAIVDIHMANMTGLDVQTRLLQDGVAMPVILITASDEPALDETARRMKALRLLRKPFPAGVLLEAVEEALATHGADTRPKPS